MMPATRGSRYLTYEYGSEASVEPFRNCPVDAGRPPIVTRSGPVGGRRVGPFAQINRRPHGRCCGGAHEQQRPQAPGWPRVERRATWRLQVLRDLTRSRAPRRAQEPDRVTSPQ